MHMASPQAQPVSMQGSLLGRLAFFVVLGFLAVVMIGPVVAVLSAVISVILSVAAVLFSIGVALLPFALVGVAVWGVYQAFAPGNKARTSAFQSRVKEFSRSFWQFTTTIWGRAYQAMHWSCTKGWVCLGFAGRGAHRAYHAVRTATAGQGRRWGRFLFETGCGMALATAACLAVSDFVPEAIPIGLVGGALIGGAVGWPRSEPRAPATEQIA